MERPSCFAYSLGKIKDYPQKYRKSFYFELEILVSKKFYEWKPSLKRAVRKSYCHKTNYSDFVWLVNYVASPCRTIKSFLFDQETIHFSQGKTFFIKQSTVSSCTVNKHAGYALLIFRCRNIPLKGMCSSAIVYPGHI